MKLDIVTVCLGIAIQSCVFDVIVQGSSPSISTSNQLYSPLEINYYALYRYSSLLQDRIARAGADGPQVERYVRELAHQRRTQPRVQPQAPGTRGADSTEVLTLKNDIRTLTQMVQELDRRVKLSFELHMDNQRLLRQEISAIAHAVVGSQSGKHSKVMPENSLRYEARSSCLLYGGFRMGVRIV